MAAPPVVAPLLAAPAVHAPVQVVAQSKPKDIKMEYVHICINCFYSVMMNTAPRI